MKSVCGSGRWTAARVPLPLKPTAVLTVVAALIFASASPSLGAAQLPGIAQCSGQNGNGTVSYNNCDPNFTTFTNGDGTYVIYKHCTAAGGGYVGPGYIARFTAALSGKVVTDDVPVAGNRLHNNSVRAPQAGNDPAQGGWGFYTNYLARGSVDPTTGNFTGSTAWSLSQRGCRGFGEPVGVRATAPGTIGIDVAGGGTGIFEEDIVLSDEPTDSKPDGLVRLHVRWKIDSSGARLYLLVTENCDNGFCGTTPNRAWMKEPRVSAQMNGQSGLTTWTHFTMFKEDDTTIGGECSGSASNFSVPWVYTQHCVDPTMTRWRLDYGPDTGGCTVNANQPCMNVIARSMRVSDYSSPRPTFRWKDTGLGFDFWAAQASGRAAPGTVPCSFRPNDTFANANRNWEIVGYNPVNNNHFGYDFGAGFRGGNVGLIAKAWEGCVGPYDASGLYRAFPPSTTQHAAYMGFSINSGWFLEQ